MKPWHDPDTGSVEDFEEWTGPLPKQKPDGWTVTYRADWSSDYGHPDDRLFRWRSPLSMPRWASRLTLELTEVRVERVASISEVDALATAADDFFHGCYDFDYQQSPPAVANFRRTWDEFDGKRAGLSWADDPWTWALSFRRIEEGGAR